MSLLSQDGIAAELIEALPQESRQNVHKRDFDKGQLVFCRGDAPRNMFSVLDGEVHLQRTSASGTPLILQRVRSGFVSEASLFHYSYHCDAIAVSATAALAFPIAVIREGLRQDRFRERWIMHLGQELRRARTQSERLGLRTARERVVHFVEMEGRDGTIGLEFSIKDWASELGVAHEVLYRTLKAMKAAGELFIDGSVVRLGKVKVET